jgi:phosphohistidine phosphatase SixA
MRDTPISSHPRIAVALWFSVLLIVQLIAPLWAPAAAPAADNVWALMKKPGHVVLLRHSNAPEGVAGSNLPESNDMDFKNCSIQRNLDQEGRAQAARIGNEFRKHGISKARLFSSQYCRAIDTAKLTKLGPVNQLPILNQVSYSELTRMREVGAKGRDFIKKIPANQITILISHVTNIYAIADVKLDSGEMAVVHINPPDQVIVDGRIKVP